MKKTLAIALKEFRQIRRDPLSLFMLLGVPAFMLVLYGYAINFDVEGVHLAVEDRDLSVQSRMLVDAFVSSGRFSIVDTPPPNGDYRRLTEEGRIKLALIIPEGFSERLGAGEQAPVQLIYDGTDATSANTAQGYANATITGFNAALMQHSLLAANAEAVLEAAIDLQPRVWYNPELRSSNFLVPGLIGFILMLTAVVSTALSVVRERERGTLQQLRVAPVHALQILIGKIVPYLVISLVAVVLILVVARILFGVAVRGSHLDLMMVTILYLIGGFGFGLFISTIARTQAVAFQMGAIASMLPALILSGFIFPIRNMPYVLQLLTYIVPARYYIAVARGIILKGTDIPAHWDELGALGVYTLLVILVASIRFARQED